MFGFYNYNKPGKGVQKRDPNQPRTSLFFELLFRKLWDLCKVNLLYVLLLIPTFIITMVIVGVVTSRFTELAAPILANIMGLETADLSNMQLSTSLIGFDLGARIVLAVLFVIFLGSGPATAGITYVLRNYAREEHAWLWSDTWRNIKSNFKQSMGLWLLDLAVFFVMVVAFDFYAKAGGWGTVATYVLLCIATMYLMMHIYVYQIMITFELKFRHVLKNSVIMALMTAPKTLLMLIILVVVHIGIPVLFLFIGNIGIPMLIFILLEIIFLPAASAFTTNFFIYNTVEKYIKQALEAAENAENATQETTDEVTEE